MVEAVVVISIFVGFFIGMVYYRSLYEQKMHVTRLARAGAVAYAMNACQTSDDPLTPIKADLGNVSDNSGSPSSGQKGDSSQGVQVPPVSSVGQHGGDPVGNAVSTSGFAGDPIAVVNLQGPASGTAKTSTLTTVGFRSTVHSTSAMSCGDKQRNGDINEALNFVKSEFNYTSDKNRAKNPSQ